MEKLNDLGRKAFVLATVALPGLVFAQATTPEAAIAEGQADIIALVAIGGAALVAIALAGVGWSVGAKFIKRLRGGA